MKAKEKIVRLLIISTIILVIIMAISCQNYSKVNEKKVNNIINQLLNDSVIQENEIIVKKGIVEFEDVHYYKAIIQKEKYLVELSCYSIDSGLSKKYKLYVSIYIPVIFHNDLPEYFSLDELDLCDLFEEICLSIGTSINYKKISDCFNDDYLINNFSIYSYKSQSGDEIVAEYTCKSVEGDLKYHLTNKYLLLINGEKDEYHYKNIDSKNGYLLISFSHYI